MAEIRLADLAQIFAQLNKDVAAAAKLLAEAARLDSNRPENIPQLKARIAKLREPLDRLQEATGRIRTAASLLAQYQETLLSVEDQLTKRFGAELDRELQPLGLSVRGQFPELRAGLFTFDLDPKRGEITIWYGPKQERLAKTKFSPSGVAKSIVQLRHSLGSGLPREQSLEVLRKAYARTGVRPGEGAAICELLFELVHLVQDTKFRHDPRKEHFKEYRRADFSFDLYRLRGATEVHLTVATRAYTRRRQDFLWVPKDENGEGTTYSHLEIKGERGS